MDPIKAAKATLRAACEAYSIARAAALSLDKQAALLGAVTAANLALKQAVAAKARSGHTTKSLRVVNNNTAAFQGGWSVETADGGVVAGPYAAQVDAAQAKVDLIHGKAPRAAS